VKKLKLGVNKVSLIITTVYWDHLDMDKFSSIMYKIEQVIFSYEKQHPDWLHYLRKVTKDTVFFLIDENETKKPNTAQ
jgi:hypothetical protein